MLTEVESSSKLSRKEATSAKLLLRAYIDNNEEEEEEEEELDEETLAEIMKIEELEGNEEIEVVLEENDDSKVQNQNNSSTPKVRMSTNELFSFHRWSSISSPHFQYLIHQENYHLISKTLLGNFRHTNLLNNFSLTLLMFL